MDKIYPEMSLNDLKDILKRKVKNVSLNDLYDLSTFFNAETEYLPPRYKNKYVKSVQNTVLERLNLIKNDTKTYEDKLSIEDVNIINELLENSEDIVKDIMNITVVYATYFLKEPVHITGDIFPGHQNVYKNGKYYYCPVKKYHIDNDKTLCKYCIAKIVKE